MAVWYFHCLLSVGKFVRPARLADIIIIFVLIIPVWFACVAVIDLMITSLICLHGKLRSVYR